MSDATLELLSVKRGDITQPAVLTLHCAGGWSMEIPAGKSATSLADLLRRMA